MHAAVPARPSVETEAGDAWLCCNGGQMTTLLSLPLRRLAGACASYLTGALLASAAHAAPAPIPDTLAQRLQACTVCHGKDGQAAPDGYRPRIAGKPAGYLYHQLLNFRDGRRHYGPMVALVDALPEPYLREIAEHAESFGHDGRHYVSLLKETPSKAAIDT